MHCAAQKSQSNKDGVPLYGGDMAAQVAGAMRNVERVLRLALLARTNRKRCDTEKAL